jgi:membrane protease YdiL (CAAX protease family)
VRSEHRSAQRCVSAFTLINQPPVSISDELLYWSVYHQDLSPTRKAALILGSITLFEGFFVVSVAFPDPRSYFVWLGFLPGRHTPSPLGYPAGLIVAGLFIAVSAYRLPSVRANLIRPSWLKLLAVGVAIFAGILEEIAFRPLLMNALQHRGTGPFLQVLASAIAFGVVHGIWAIFGGHLRAGIGAVAATSLLGAGLAIVYLIAGRSVAPCIVAHFLLDLFVEPGLVLAAVRGEMSLPSPHESLP